MVIEHDSADALLSSLMPWSDWRRESEHPPKLWIFRGQADASWPIVPTAFRGLEHGNKPEILKWNRYKGRFDASTEERRRHWAGVVVAAELDLISQFAVSANRHGLEVPQFEEHFAHVPAILDRVDDSYRRVVDETESDDGWQSTLDRMLHVSAIARHHGLPSRLVDFSVDPMVAAFFGAHSAKTRREYWAVWALNISPLWSRDGANVDGAGRRRVEVVEANRFRNPNLRAQRALFLADRHAMREFIATGQCPTVELAVHGACGGCSSPPLVRHVAPPEVAEECLNRLEELGYSASKLTPSYDSIVKRLGRNR